MSDQFSTILKTIGLTTAETKVYLFMMRSSHDSWRVRHIKEKLKISSSSLYRALNGLTIKGFVRSSRVIGATSWCVVPITHALYEYAQYQRTVAKPLISWQHDYNSD